MAPCEGTDNVKLHGPVASNTGSVRRVVCKVRLNNETVTWKQSRQKTVWELDQACNLLHKDIEAADPANRRLCDEKVLLETLRKHFKGNVSVRNTSVDVAWRDIDGLPSTIHVQTAVAAVNGVYHFKVVHGLDRSRQKLLEKFPEKVQASPLTACWKNVISNKELDHCMISYVSVSIPKDWEAFMMSAVDLQQKLGSAGIEVVFILVTTAVRISEVVALLCGVLDPHQRVFKWGQHLCVQQVQVVKSKDADTYLQRASLLEVGTVLDAGASYLPQLREGKAAMIALDPHPEMLVGWTSSSCGMVVAAASAPMPKVELLSKAVTGVGCARCLQGCWEVLAAAVGLPPPSCNLIGGSSSSLVQCDEPLQHTAEVPNQQVQPNPEPLLLQEQQIDQLAVTPASTADAGPGDAGQHAPDVKMSSASTSGSQSDASTLSAGREHKKGRKGGSDIDVDSRPGLLPEGCTAAMDLSKSFAAVKDNSPRKGASAFAAAVSGARAAAAGGSSIVPASGGATGLAGVLGIAGSSSNSSSAGLSILALADGAASGSGSMRLCTLDDDAAALQAQPAMQLLAAAATPGAVALAAAGYGALAGAGASANHSQSPRAHGAKRKANAGRSHPVAIELRAGPDHEQQQAAARKQVAGSPSAAAAAVANSVAAGGGAAAAAVSAPIPAAAAAQVLNSGKTQRKAAAAASRKLAAMTHFQEPQLLPRVYGRGYFQYREAHRLSEQPMPWRAAIALHGITLPDCQDWCRDDKAKYLLALNSLSNGEIAAPQQQEAVTAFLEVAHSTTAPLSAEQRYSRFIEARPSPLSAYINAAAAYVGRTQEVSAACDALYELAGQGLIKVFVDTCSLDRAPGDQVMCRELSAMDYILWQGQDQIYCSSFAVAFIPRDEAAVNILKDGLKSMGQLQQQAHDSAEQLSVDLEALLRHPLEAAVMYAKEQGVDVLEAGAANIHMAAGRNAAKGAPQLLWVQVKHARRKRHQMYLGVQDVCMHAIEGCWEENSIARRLETAILTLCGIAAWEYQASQQLLPAFMRAIRPSSCRSSQAQPSCTAGSSKQSVTLLLKAAKLHQ